MKASPLCFFWEIKEKVILQMSASSSSFNAKGQNTCRARCTFGYGCCWELRMSRKLANIVHVASEKKNKRLTGTVGRLCKSGKIRSKPWCHCGFMPKAKQYIPSLEWGIIKMGWWARTGRMLWTSQRCHGVWWLVPRQQPRKRRTHSSNMCHSLSSSSSFPLLGPSQAHWRAERGVQPNYLDKSGAV